MAKAIRITEDIRKNAQDEFTKLLDGLKMSDGKISYSKTLKYKEATAVLRLSQLAYRKTVALVTNFSDEVAWHGLAVRKAKNEFVIEDILVYPQETTNVTVNTDSESYTKWLYGLDDEAFNNIRMQSHSHVNMGVNPSGVDDSHREKILDQLDEDMFYIFMVWNKSLDTHTLIYDMENNVLYENDDITVEIIGDASFKDFLTDANEKVQKKKTTVYKVKPSKDEDKKTEQGSFWERIYRCDDMYDPYELSGRYG